MKSFHMKIWKVLFFIFLFMKMQIYVIIYTKLFYSNLGGISMNLKAVIIFTVIIILVSLQYTLNKILVELREIKEILKKGNIVTYK